MAKRLNKNLLVGTLGMTWSIIPELLGFTNRDDVSLFANRSDLEEVSKGLSKIDEIWLVATKGAIKNIASLFKWQQLCDLNKLPIKVWVAEDIEDIDNESKIRDFRELIWRLVYKGIREFGSQNLFCCLAGGRKTMSADLQEAATFFGCKCLLHLADTGNIPPHLARELKVETLTRPLSEEDSRLFFPVILGKDINGSELLDYSKINSDISLNEEINKDSYISVQGLKTNLTTYVEKHKHEADNLYLNHTRSLTENDLGNPFHALYALSGNDIKALKKCRIGKYKKNETEEKKWLRRLPKTDLHCHLGGIANASELIEIASSVKEDIKEYNEKLSSFFKFCNKYIQNGEIKKLREKILSKNTSFKDYFNDAAQSLNIPVWIVTSFFILLFEKEPNMLDDFIFGKLKNESEYIGVKIEGYEHLGDLQGSTLLQTEKTIRAACRILIRNCIEQNIKYIEVRCSPINYTRCGLKDTEVFEFIRSELAKGEPKVHFGIIFIASRHGKMSNCWRHVELAQEIWKDNEKASSLVGFDLAGNEKFEATNFVPVFKPLFENCFHITVHAGETESVDSIQKAVYYLNAERIGHGLKLIENEKLMTLFSDRRIAIEMCPSSNMQIIGYRTNFMSKTDSLQVYPLCEYLKRGLKVCVNTDNPGISRTTITDELYRAARMSRDGLSKWDILQLIKNGFKSTFARYELKSKCLREAEQEILRILLEHA